MIGITLTKLRCARCNRQFQVMDMDKKTEFRCPHPRCKCRHVKLHDGWFDERIEQARKTIFKGEGGMLP